MSKIIARAEVTNNGDQYTSKVQINQHSLIVDEPTEKGGADLGPAPGDYLCAALASCKAITLRMYVQRKKWSVEQIKVTVHLVPGKETSPGNNTFFCRLNFIGQLDDEQQKRLLFIANACPLHRMLSKPGDIVTTIM
jgi:putative redox protein